MSYTNQTANYGLPQYTADDKPTYLGDFNKAMLDIDTAIKANENIAQASQTLAQNANNSASEALSTANTASSSATNAGVKADNAYALAESAKADATQATTDATDAKTIANSANQTATSANATATSAQTTATNANNTATSAQTTANSANTKATANESRLDNLENYSDTSETLIGTWIDGNPLYRKVLVIDALSQNDLYSFLVTGIEDIVSISGIAKFNNRFQPIPRVLTDNLNQFAIGIGDIDKTSDSISFRMQKGSTYTNFVKATIILEYTKHNTNAN